MEGSKGIVALAMEKVAPYGIAIGAVPDSPEAWCSELPRECHLLYFDVLADAAQAEHLCRVLFEKVNASVAGFFAVSPHEAVRTFLSVKEYLEAEATKGAEMNQEERSQAEGERLSNLADEYANGSLKVIKDPKRAFELYKQSAELGYPSAFLNLSWSYRYGNGVKKDLNAALQWAHKCIEPTMDDTIRLWGFSNAAQCFLEAEMCGEAEQTWRRCFTEMEDAFHDRHTTAVVILGLYALDVASLNMPAVHPVGISMLFPVVVEDIRKHAQGRELPKPQNVAIRWLTENSPS